MSDPDACDSEIFEHGHSVAMLDACRYVAEEWVKLVAKESGQRIDWHYAGGRANVLYLGDHAAVVSAIGKLQPKLEKRWPFESGQCGSCISYGHHRPARVLAVYGPAEFGPWRANKALTGEE
jgi:hypothetical protein